jgi:putative ABC transport system permease protein
LLLRTLIGLRAEPLGFDPRQVLRGAIATPRARYATDEQRIALYDALLARLRAVPGVERAALSSNVPLQGGDSDMGFLIEGREAPRVDGDGPVSWYRVVSASYFETVRIPLRQGRLFAEREPAPSVVINETLARRYWPGSNPIGQRIGAGPEGPWFTIIGVVGDVKFAGARGSTRNEMYIPYWQLPESGTNIVLRTSGAPERLAGAVREAVRDVDGLMPVAGLQPLSELVSRSVELPRFLATMVMLFAAMALVLAAIGIYGVMAFSVTQRTAEMGVRMALGAGRGAVLRLVMGDGLRLAVVGVAIGAAGALLLSRAMSSLLFGVGAADPLTFTLTSLVLLLVAARAAFLPARRVAAVDPRRALRSE